MPNVIVTPLSQISVRVGPGAPAAVQSTAQFVGASDVREHTQGAYDTANTAFVKANASFNTANSSYIRANNSIDATNGGTVAGKITISNTTPSVSNSTGALILAGGLGVSGNVYIDSLTLTSNNFNGNSITFDAGSF
jgi:hypothetical protein